MSERIVEISSHAPQDKGSDTPHRRKNRPGRSARTRRRKALDIKNAERELFSGVKSVPSILPVDRSLVREVVLEKRKRFSWNENDEAAIVRQLGYVPGNAIRVVSRVSALPKSILESIQGVYPSDPVVLQLYPLALRERKPRNSKSRKRKHQESDNKGQLSTTFAEPFPTIFWLTNPELRALISQLELEGMGSRLEKRLANDATALESMKKAHLAYGRERRDLIAEEDWNVVSSHKWEAAFSETRGVAGIRNYSAIKCLHTHAAHYLSGNQDNIVGKWVLENVEKRQNERKKENCHES